MNDIRVIVPRDSFKNLGQLYKDFAEYTRQMYEDIIKEEGALTCREAMVYSPPLDGQGGGKGDTKTAEKWGNWAVERDVHSFVVSKNKILSLNIDSQSAFNKWKNTVNPNVDKTDSVIAKIRRDANVKRAYQQARNLLGNKPQAKIEVLTTEAQIKAKHDQLRGQYKGRIRKNRGPKLMQPYVADQKLIDAYIKNRQQRVGWMKSAWLDAIRQIGPPMINGVAKNFGVKDLNKFITRHVNSQGYAGLSASTSSAGKIDLTVRNNIGDIFSVSSMAGTVQAVQRAREGKMFKRLQHLQRAAIDKTNKGTKNS